MIYTKMFIVAGLIGLALAASAGSGSAKRKKKQNDAWDGTYRCAYMLVKQDETGKRQYIQDSEYYLGTDKLEVGGRARVKLSAKSCTAKFPKRNILTIKEIDEAKQRVKLSDDGKCGECKGTGKKELEKCTKCNGSGKEPKFYYASVEDVVFDVRKLILFFMDTHFDGVDKWMKRHDDPTNKFECSIFFQDANDWGNVTRAYIFKLPKKFARRICKFLHKVWSKGNARVAGKERNKKIKKLLAAKNAAQQLAAANKTNLFENVLKRKGTSNKPSETAGRPRSRSMSDLSKARTGRTPAAQPRSRSVSAPRVHVPVPNSGSLKRDLGSAKPPKRAYELKDMKRRSSPPRSEISPKNPVVPQPKVDQQKLDEFDQKKPEQVNVLKDFNKMDKAKPKKKRSAKSPYDKFADTLARTKNYYDLKSLVTDTIKKFMEKKHKPARVNKALMFDAGLLQKYLEEYRDSLSNIVL